MSNYPETTSEALSKAQAEVNASFASPGLSGKQHLEDAIQILIDVLRVLVASRESEIKKEESDQPKPLSLVEAHVVFS